MTKVIPLSQQVILITGASTGIGAALAHSLAKTFPGIRIALSARTQTKLEQVAASCRQAGAEVLVVATDMAELDQVRALAQKVLDCFGRVDVLINNAGYGQMGPLELVSPPAANRQFAVNVHGPLFLTQALVPVMRNQGGGRIINISSLGGRMAFPAGGLYSASKFALEALSDVWRMELEAFNIKVSVIEPGPVKTEFFAVATQAAKQSHLDPKVALYQAPLQKIEELKQQTEMLGWTPERVSQVVIRALMARHPRPRYVAATGGRIFLFLMTKVLPTWVTDIFWKRFYGIDEVGKAWKDKQWVSTQ